MAGRFTSIHRTAFPRHFGRRSAISITRFMNWMAARHSGWHTRTITAQMFCFNIAHVLTHVCAPSVVVGAAAGAAAGASTTASTAFATVSVVFAAA